MKFTPTMSYILIGCALIVGIIGCSNNSSQSTTNSTQTSATNAGSTDIDILSSYAKIAKDAYYESLKDAQTLQKTIEDFKENPTQAVLDKVKSAWLQSRESYGQTEAFRLSNGPIDAEDGWVADKYGSLEGQLNAWPLDENIIDYTIDKNGKRTSGNIIDTLGNFTPDGDGSTGVDVSTITPEAITALNENGGESNVATGYHAIEFLLWGQDQDYASFKADTITNGALVAGQRPLSDFTTDKNAKRRLSYLEASSQKIIDDLKVVYSAWDNGDYAKALVGKLNDASRNIAPKVALKQIFSGLGVFIKSELANERIAVAVLTPSEEDEHSCFSDNTHRDITTNYQGFKNILTSTYNGNSYGASAFDNISDSKKKEITNLMNSIENKIAKINNTANTSKHFDYQIQDENSPEAKNIVSLKNELRRLGDKMIDVAQANGINLNASDVTDADETQL